MGPCTVANGTLTAQYTLTTQAETEVTWFYLYVSEYDATGTLSTSIRLSFEHPFTVGEDLTGSAAVNASVVSCQITNATGAKI
jgi:predicted carbohydrate-binding protein with CBM5 and CBM33 domain